MRTSALVLAPALAAMLLAPRAHASAPPTYQRHICPDGLEIIVVERHATPLVTIEIGVHNGAMTEPPEYNGLSHLYEHMFFKGNKALPDQLTYLARTRELGMLFNGTTGEDRVNYFFTTTSDHFADAMVFMRDAITSPLFDAKELERERVVVTGEMDRDESDPRFLLWRAMEEKVFWKYPSRKNPLGARKTVLTTTPAMMHTIQNRYYVPNNSVLVIVGDVTTADVFNRADQLYANWLSAPDPFVKFPLVKDPPIRRSEVVVVQKPVQTFTASFEWQGPSTLGPSAPMTYPADLLSTLMADPGSKFQRDLVDSGACVRASFSWQTLRDVGPIWADFEAAPTNVDKCVAAVAAELPKLEAPDYFSDDEIQNAAHRIDVQLAQEREGTESYSHQITFYWADANLDYYNTYSDKLHAVTRADMAKFLDTYVLHSPFVFGALESPELAKTASQKHLEGLVGIGRAAAAAVKKGGAR